MCETKVVQPSDRDFNKPVRQVFSEDNEFDQCWANSFERAKTEIRAFEEEGTPVSKVEGILSPLFGDKATRLRLGYAQSSTPSEGPEQALSSGLKFE